MRTYLRGPERDHLTGSGRDMHEVFDTPLGKVGMLICWDLAFPEAFRELIAAGAKIMYVKISFPPHSERTARRHGLLT
jgi:predicted amidohydrolase